MPKTPELSVYLGGPIRCQCGHIHETDLKGCKVGQKALGSIVDYVKHYGFKKLYLACDEITYEIAGKKVMSILEEAKINAKIHIFKGGRFIPNEKALGDLMIDADRDCDLVVAVGTGSINDMCRFFSYQMKIPYAIVATAAPMDGFASSGAALMVDNIKQTIPAQAPLFIIGDTDILKNAPERMISAGLGDLLGKFTCLNDWRISKLINDEYYCDFIVDLVKNCIENVLSQADKVSQRDPEVIGNIMEGLVLTGVAMSFVGNSRPAAGCEHHLNHYWEAIELQNGQIPVLHGLEVGLAEVVILKMTEFLRENRPDFQKAREKAKEYNQEAWEQKMKEVYGTASDAIIELERKVHKNEPNGRLKRIDQIEANWDEIVRLLDEYQPSSSRMIEILKSLNAPYFPSQVGFSDEMLYNALVYGKENRERYTLLSMMADLGVIEELASRVVEFVNEKKEG